MSIEELKVHLRKLPRVSVIYVDAFVFQKMLLSFSDDDIKLIESYYEFLLTNNQMTTFDKEKYDILVSYRGRSKEFGYIKTSFGLLRYSNN